MSKKKLVKAKVEKRDGGYLFPELGIHVAANSEENARKLVKQYHGIDVDEEVTRINEDAERAEKEAAKVKKTKEDS